MSKGDFFKSQRFNFGGKQISIKAEQEKSPPAPADTFLALTPEIKWRGDVSNLLSSVDSKL
jgi:hypothetical protein